MVRQPARVIFFTGGSLLRFVVVRPTPDGTRSLARHRSGDTIVLPSELPARDVADGWELRARRAGVYAGWKMVR